MNNVIASRFSIGTLVLAVTSFCIAIAFFRTAQMQSARLSKLSRDYSHERAQDGFSVQALVVRRNFRRNGSMCLLNKLECTENPNGGVIVWEFGYKVPNAIKEIELRKTLEAWISPLAEDIGSLAPRGVANWSTSVTPNIYNGNSQIAREGMMRIEKRYSLRPETIADLDQSADSL